jgi:hypothetical protein
MFNSFIIDRHKKTRVQTFNQRKDKPDIYDIIRKIQCPSTQTNIFPMQERIIAIGDIHGDFESLIYLLYTSKVINNELKWIGGETFVVQTGDIFDDRRPDFPEEFKPHEPYDELLIIEYLADLNIQAEKEGGRVLLCYGNHELINIFNPGYFQDYSFNSTHEYNNKRLNMLPGRIVATKLACIMNLFVIIGNYIFVHGSLTYEIINDIDKNWGDDSKKYNPLNNMITLNNKLKETLQQHLSTYDGLPTSHEVSKLGLIITEDRSMAIPIESTELEFCNMCNNFNKVVVKLLPFIYNNKEPTLKLVIGHTGSHHGLKATCDRRIFRIDTYISRAFGPASIGNPNISDRIAYLEISGDIDTGYEEKGYIVIIDDESAEPYEVEVPLD